MSTGPATTSLASAEARNGVPSVAERLFAEPHRFDFEQVVKLLEASLPGRAPVGEGVEPQREGLRFRARTGLGAPRAPVEEVRPPRSPDDPVEVVVSFLTLAGVEGPLPDWVTELVLDRGRQGDEALRDFLDIFHHRLVSLFHRALVKGRPALRHAPPDESRLAVPGFAYLGLGLPSLRDRTGLRDRALLPYAGLVGPGPRSQVGLERLVEGYFGVPASVEPFQARWWTLEEEDLTRIGARGRGRNQALGRSAVLGSRVRDPAAAIRLRLGPLDLKGYLSFLPTGDRWEALGSLVRFYAGPELEVEVHLVLESGEVPDLALGSAGDTRLGYSMRLGGGDPAPDGGGGGGAALGPVRAQARLGGAGGGRLGWTTWLGGPPPGGRPGEVTLESRGRPSGSSREGRRRESVV